MRTRLLSLAVLFLLGAAAAAQTTGSSATGSAAIDKDKRLGKTLATWISELNSATDPSVKVNCIEAVILFGEDAQKDAGASLVKFLADQDASVRVHSAIAISVIGLHSKDLRNGVAELTRRINDQQAIVRYHSLRALGVLGGEAKSAITELARATRDASSWEVRRAAVYALGRAGAASETQPPNNLAISTLAAIFTASERCAAVRLEAVMALGAIGKPALEHERNAIVQALQRAVADRDKTVSLWARVAILAHVDQQIDPKLMDQQIDAIAKLAKPTEKVEIRIQAIRALAIMKEKTKRCVPDLIDMLSDKEPYVVATVVYALGDYGQTAYKAEPMLKKMMQDKNLHEVVKQAIEESLPRLAGRAAK